MIDGLKFIQMDSANNITGVIADDHDTNPFDTEDDFNKNSIYWSDLGYRCYYFGGGDDGAMRTNKTTIDIDGDRFSFYFEKSGGHKGAGLTGEKDDKFYQSGKLITAGKDEKYQVVKRTDKSTNTTAASKYTYSKLDDVKEFLDTITSAKYASGVNDANLAKLKDLGVNKKADDLNELYIIDDSISSNDYFLVNTSGKVIDTKSKNKEGNDYIYVVKKGGKIAAIYAEN